MSPSPSHPDRRGVVAGLTGLAAAALAPGRARAQARPGPLARGINLSHWFAQSSHGYGAAHLAGFVTPAELGRIAAAGFDHVRLSVEPAILFAKDGPPALVEPVLAQLAGALDRIAAAGLAVVVDLHPVGNAKDGLLTRGGADDFVARWRLLAGALAPRDPDRTIIEILNEPEPLKGEAWWDLQGRALAAIREAGARQAVIVNGGAWSGIDDLVAREPYPDRRLVYTIHHYAPLLFTHQATTWSWDVARRVSGLGWPVAADQAEAAAAAATRDAEAHGFVRDQIAQGQFSRAALEAQFDRLSLWQSRHGGLPVYVGEFGVYVRAAPLEARLAWVRAARESFERRGWGWALWDNSAEFGFLAATNDRRSLDPLMLRALGVQAS